MRNSRGNILFLILIAVALFAALSYAVTKSTSGSSGGIDREKAKLVAAELMQYAISVEVAIQRQVLSGKTTFNELCFMDANIPGTHFYNAGTCTAGTNEDRVFHSEGGGVNYLVPDPTWLDSQYSAHGQYGRINYTGTLRIIDVGTGENDLMMGLHHVKPEICKEINEAVGLPFPAPGDYMCCGWDAARHFRGDSDGDWGTAGASGGFGDQDAVYRGNRTGCVLETDANPDAYFFYHVLQAR